MECGVEHREEHREAHRVIHRGEHREERQGGTRRNTEWNKEWSTRWNTGRRIGRSTVWKAGAQCGTGRQEHRGAQGKIKQDISNATDSAEQHAQHNKTLLINGKRIVVLYSTELPNPVSVGFHSTPNEASPHSAAAQPFTKCLFLKKMYPLFIHGRLPEHTCSFTAMHVFKLWEGPLHNQCYPLHNQCYPLHHQCYPHCTTSTNHTAPPVLTTLHHQC